MSVFKVGDRIRTRLKVWALQDGSVGLAYGRIVGKLSIGRSYVEFDMGANGRLTILMDDAQIDHDAEAGCSPPRDGQADTPGIKRDFEPGGLTGDSIW